MVQPADTPKKTKQRAELFSSHTIESNSIENKIGGIAFACKKNDCIIIQLLHVLTPLNG